jgi:phosphoglycerate dehydrogenase-like enzyme
MRKGKSPTWNRSRQSAISVGNDAALTAAVRSTAAEILVVRGTKVPAATLAASRLSLVVRPRAGYDTIDVPAVSARGIYTSRGQE